MLPVPNLDDRMYEDMVKDARKMIPKLLPQWTDENAHDPGITMVEMFAWLTEMQQYYLNRVTTRNEMKFLQLLGVRLRQAKQAQVEVSFDNIQDAVMLPSHTKLSADGQTFETLAPLLLHPARIDRVLVQTATDSVDYTAANHNFKGSFYAFGSPVRVGHRMYIAFDRELPVSQPISLTVNLYEDYGIAVNPIQNGETEVVPSAKVSWRYYAGGGDGAVLGWVPLEIVEDQTLHLSKSGLITFQLPGEMLPEEIYPANDKRRYWICCTVEETGYELPPKVVQVALNTVSAAHSDTRSRVVSFDGTGVAGQAYTVQDYLACFGQHAVQVQRENGDWAFWRTVQDFSGCGPLEECCVIEQDDRTHSLTLRFGDGTNGKMPAKGTGNVRLLVWMKEFEEQRWLGASNGLPDQRFELAMPMLLADSVRLQVGVLVSGTTEMVWQDWTQVDDFAHSGPTDRHFMIDQAGGELVFGNHERGIIPETSTLPNLLLTALQLGGGERGNVQRNLIDEIIDPRQAFAGITVTNPVHAAGGQERETLAGAKLRLRKELQRPTRGVTAVDYEAIARSTPGLRVARVKALPMFTVGMTEYPREKAPGQVTVVVVPYSESANPMPSQGFLQTVQGYLDQHRLLTTELHVIPPEYIKVTVHAVVVVEPEMLVQKGRIEKVLAGYLDPLDDEDPNKGWEFGRAVYKGDIYGIINQLSGVVYIHNLWLQAEGRGIVKDESGDIQLPPHGLVYSGEHVIELVSRTDL